jgi:PAS domain S-box-containing protein
VSVVGLLGLAGTLGYLAVVAAPAQTHAAGMWPVGLVAGLLLVSTPRALPTTAGLVVATAFATIALGGYPLLVAAGYAVGITVEGLLVRAAHAVLWGEGRRLDDDRDMARYLATALVGAAAGGLLFAVTSAATGFGVGWQVGLATFTTHLASQLILLAFFVDELGDHAGVSGRLETALRWSLAVSVTFLAFVPTHLPALAFFILPVLGWTALRASMREALWQLVTVGVLASTLTQLGRGPLVALDIVGGRSEELHVLPQQGFLVACALACLPFAMAANRQRRTATDAARERERLERIVSGATGMAIIETDPTGRITLFNPGAQAMLGYAEEEVLGQWPDMFFSRAEVERHAEALGVPADLVHVGLAHAAPGTGARDWNYIDKAGRIRTMSMAASRITGSGRTAGFLITAEDITERVHTQQALQAALDAERQAVTRLTELDRSKDAFVSSVSHELRTPITNIVGYLELLLDGSCGDTTRPQAQALSRIDENSHRLLELIDDLLTLSSIETLDIDARQQPVDLREVIRRSGARMHTDLAARGQRLDVQLPDEPVVVLGDEHHLEQMVHKLATNAVKFTPSGGTIVLRVRAGEGECAIEVQDTGVGIPDEDQPLLFNRFFRSRHAHEEAVKGTGLGLPIARSIARRHGADISATSAPGRGSVFTVTFSKAGTVPNPRTPS